MPYIILSLWGLLKNRKGNSLSFFLFAILFASTIGAYLVGRQPDIFEADTLFYTLYIAMLLFVMYNSFSKYRGLCSFSLNGVNKKRLQIVENAIIAVSIIVLILYIYILYHSLALLAMKTVTVNEFKNDDDGATELFDSLFPHIVSTFLNFFSPLAFFNIVFHFYHLINKEFKKSILFFLLSLVYPLSGLIALSRSTSVQYVLLYFALYFFLYPLIDNKVRKAFNKVLLVFVTLVFAIFAFISVNRFSEYYSKESKQVSVINEQNNPLMFSLFDYLSQWEENGPEIMKLYKPEYKFYGLYNTSGLALQIKRRVTHEDEVTKIAERAEKIMGRQYMMFHGLIARLIYDFGYIGTILFILIYSRIIRSFSPRRGILNLKTLMVLAILLPLPLMSFQGNVLGGLAPNMAIIYLFIIVKFIGIKKVKIKQQPVIINTVAENC